jgi:plastocyanin
MNSMNVRSRKAAGVRVGAFLGALALGLTGAGGAVAVAPAPVPGAAAGSSAVMMQNVAFAPAQISVRTGGTVTWMNMDTVPHTVTGGPIRSSSLDHNAQFSFTFSSPGTYAYYCAIHPDMRGTVVVGG